MFLCRRRGVASWMLVLLLFSRSGGEAFTSSRVGQQRINKSSTSSSIQQPQPFATSCPFPASSASTTRLASKNNRNNNNNNNNPQDPFAALAIIQSAILAFGVGFLVLGFVLPLFGYDFVMQEGGRVGIGTVEEAQFQRETVKAMKEEPQNKQSSVISADSAVLQQQQVTTE